ncbi:ParB-like nuclease domain protein [uncultured archaeon]|nr:ParB-like nuclease domain protein [uncultured archaeon]
MIDISDLKPHEEIDPKRVFQIQESIIKEGLKHPIVVDKLTKIILDGHHRYNVMKSLKIDKVPVFYVDYFDSRIVVDSWNGLKLTKNDVINNVREGKLFPNKTTKHMFISEKGVVHISLITPEINVDILNLRTFDNPY